MNDHVEKKAAEKTALSVPVLNQFRCSSEVSTTAEVLSLSAPQ